MPPLRGFSTRKQLQQLEQFQPSQPDNAKQTSRQPAYGRQARSRQPDNFFSLFSPKNTRSLNLEKVNPKKNNTIKIAEIGRFYPHSRYPSLTLPLPFRYTLLTHSLPFDQFPRNHIIIPIFLAIALFQDRKPS
jgi:hypothetical protein